MKYNPLSSSFYINSRKAFMAELRPKSLAVFNSNDIYPISADSTLPFEQHRDIFYLSGIDQEESILVLFPNAFEEKQRETLESLYDDDILTDPATLTTSGRGDR